MREVLSLMVTLLLSGCVTQLSDFERDWRRGVDKNNWELCKRVYRESKVPMISSHDHQKHKPHRPNEIKQDLADNRCRSILKGYWENY